MGEGGAVAQLAVQDILRFLNTAAVAGQRVLGAGNRERKGSRLLPVLTPLAGRPSQGTSSVGAV